MTKLAILLVGLPARGKTYISRKVARYLAWLGYDTQVFNVGNYRRERVGAKLSHEFFDPDNAETEHQRMEIAMEALEDLIAWLTAGGEVAIYDATNSTQHRRARVRQRCEEAGVQVLFIESVCNDESIIDANVRETKLTSPDYEGMDPDRAVADFKQRIHHYERAYEPVQEDVAVIRITDVGRLLVAQRIQGYLPSKLAFFLLNIHNVRRPIFLTRHGESEHNVRRLIGGDSPLSSRGEAYADELGVYIDGLGANAPKEIWTSTLERSISTGRRIKGNHTEWKALDEIAAGVCDGMTYEAIAEQMPEEHAARKADKLGYRYPRGESYVDVIERLEPVIIELERQREPVLVVGHLAVLRALYSYLGGIPREACTHLPFALHTLLKMTPTAYGYDEESVTPGPRVTWNPESLPPKN